MADTVTQLNLLQIVMKIVVQKFNPTNGHLKYCRQNCFTNKKTKNAPLAGTRFVKTGGDQMLSW